MLLRIVAVAFGLMACGGVKDPISSETGEDTKDTDTNSCGFSESDNLPDYSQGLDEDACADGAYYEPTVPTAHSYYINRIHIDDCDNVTGEEVWILFAGDKLKEAGFDDCEMIWDIEGVKTEAKGVGDYSLDLSFTFNEAKSTCTVEDFVDEEGTNFTVRYDVDVQSGDVTLFFKSGEEYATGSANGNHISTTSPLSCKLF